jgi:hypothetical protein
MSSVEFAIEMIFINWAKRVTVDHEDFINFLKSRYVNREREFTVLKAYGWHDYVVISKNPIPTPTTFDQLITDEGWNCVESSILGWILKVNTDSNNADKHYLAIIRAIEKIIPSLSKDDSKLSDAPNLYVLSLVSLNRECPKRFIDLRDWIDGGVIIHCVGIWDIAIIVKIKKDGNQIDHIEKYKRKFLYSDYVKRSSSTILVGLTKNEIEKVYEKTQNDEKFKNVFKPTLEELLR